LRARQLRPLIAELADEIERERRLPDELLGPMHDAGMFNMMLPQELGGPELDPWSAFEVVEQLSMADASVGWCAMIASVGSWGEAFLPSDAAATIYDSASTVLAGSVLGKAETRVVDGGFLLSGRFQFASGCLHANWMSAVVPDPRCEGQTPHPRLLAFLPTSACQIVDNWYTTGLRGTSSNDWTTQDSFIPWDYTYRFLPNLETPRFAHGPLYRYAIFGLTSVMHSAVQVGAAEGAMAGYLQRIQERERRGVALKHDSRVQMAVESGG
jgi:alkylation response protein AidB-like acyl-CoA dehydrogenase